MMKLAPGAVEPPVAGAPMSDLRATVTAAMKALIEGAYGCYDAAAETINARWGRGGSKGTISRKVGGLLDWTVADVVALEDASGRYPVTRILARRLYPTARDNACIVEHASAISREAGQAVCAMLEASLSADAGDIAAAIAELNDVDAFVRAAIARLEDM